MGLPPSPLIFGTEVSGRGLRGACATCVPPGNTIVLALFTGFRGAVVLVLPCGAGAG